MIPSIARPLCTEGSAPPLPSPIFSLSICFVTAVLLYLHVCRWRLRPSRFHAHRTPSLHPSAPPTTGHSLGSRSRPGVARSRSWEKRIQGSEGHRSPWDASMRLAHGTPTMVLEDRGIWALMLCFIYFQFRFCNKEERKLSPPLLCPCQAYPRSTRSSPSGSCPVTLLERNYIWSCFPLSYGAWVYFFVKRIRKTSGFMLGIG
jgi:hypothetical protein